MASFNEENRAAPQREEPPFQNKYGGISPKKPLISKDHERAYFDSADWVLGKQAAGNGAKGPTEPLKPKMQVRIGNNLTGFQGPPLSEVLELWVYDPPGF